MIRRPPRSTLFPYPPLSRSGVAGQAVEARRSVPCLRLEVRAGAGRVGQVDPSDLGGRERLSREQVTPRAVDGDRKSTRLNSSHANISYAVFCLKKKNHTNLF